MDQRSRTRPENIAYRSRFQTSRGDYSRTISRTSVDGFPFARAQTISIPQSTPAQIEKTVTIPHKITQHHLPKQSPPGTLSRRTDKKKPKLLQLLRGRPLMPIALSGMAILLFSFGILVALNTIHTNKTALAQVNGLNTVNNENNSSDEGVPSEDEPSGNLGSYSVAPDMPKILKIDKISVNARIKSLGVTNSGALKAPRNIFDVGWYEGGAKPDEHGAIVLDGHVSGPSKKGVFYKLGSLKPGDKVTVVRGDNQEFNYTVTDIREYDSDKVDMPKVLTTSVAGKKGLNLITCTGDFNARTNSFEKRVVVFTTQD